MNRVAILRAAVLVLATAARAHAGLTEGPRLAAVYDTILNARFDLAEVRTKQACPPAPVEACQALRAVAIWWQILLNPESRQLDGRLEAAAASAVAASEAWTRREPQRGEAWFYLAGAYAPRVQLHVLRGERLSAAFDGKRIKTALERALQLDPTLNDAYFGIGLYHYYADVAPTAAKMLRWLLFLPGGDRAQGLREMLQARAKGELLGGEADYQLHVLYLWYEQKTADALALLDGLDRRYPNNLLFAWQIAEVRSVYLHDHEGSADAWRALLARALTGQANSASAIAVRARLGLANELAAINQVDQALEQLQIVIETRPTAPSGAVERAERQQRAVLAQKSRR